MLATCAKTSRTKGQKKVKTMKKGGKAGAKAGGSKAGVKAGATAVVKAGRGAGAKAGGKARGADPWKEDGVEDGYKEILRNNCVIPKGAMARIRDWAAVLREMTTRFPAHKTAFSVNSLQKKKSRLATRSERSEPWDVATQEEVEKAGGTWKEPNRKSNHVVHKEKHDGKGENAVFAENNNGASLHERNEGRFKEKHEDKSRGYVRYWADVALRQKLELPTLGYAKYWADVERRWAKGLPPKGVERGRTLNDLRAAGRLAMARHFSRAAAATSAAVARLRLSPRPAFSSKSAVRAAPAQPPLPPAQGAARKRKRDDPQLEGRIMMATKLARIAVEAADAARRIREEKAAAEAAGEIDTTERGAPPMVLVYHDDGKISF
jgi:hypothetical protein